MFRIAIVAIGGLLALAGPASAAQPHGFLVDGPFSVTGGPRVNQVELENTMITSYAVHAPGTQVGSEG